MSSISWQKHRTNDSVLTELSLKTELMGTWQSWNYNILATLLGEVQDSWHLQSLKESRKGYGIKADREDSGYTTLKSGLAVNTFS